MSATPDAVLHAYFALYGLPLTTVRDDFLHGEGSVAVTRHIINRWNPFRRIEIIVEVDDDDRRMVEIRINHRWKLGRALRVAYIYHRATREKATVIVV